MKHIWVAIDVSCLAYRVWYSLPKLSWKGQPTEVLFGFFRAVEEVRNLFGSDNLVFCFDSKDSKRKELYPEYKAGRRRHDDLEHKQRRKAFHIQMDLLKNRCLPLAGFRNIFAAKGYESDDILAVVAKTVVSRGTDELVIVTRDSDIYQCLRPNVFIYDPQLKKVRDVKWFTQTYGIEPPQWAKVKALAGCQTDNVPGIRGIGQKTALNFLRAAANLRVIELVDEAVRCGAMARNMQLVKLPFHGCPSFKLCPQNWNRVGWSKMLRGIGIKEF